MNDSELSELKVPTMQLMTLNSLLMFDVVFFFFLFLVGVSCLIYYLPGGRVGSITPAHEIISGKMITCVDAPLDHV